MRWYIVVEGRQTEKRLYGAWLSYAFPEIAQVTRIEDMADNSYFLVIGNGYPSYLRRIENAIKDIAELPDRFDHLWIHIDAEEMVAADLRIELEMMCAENACPVEYSVVIQDCCIETWLLGNRKFAKANPQSPRLRAFYEHHNVRDLDPEVMLAMAPNVLRAPFHLQYLREMFQERKLTYTKKHPGEAGNLSYWRELVRRVGETEHLQSLRFLIERWRRFGGKV